MKAKGSPEGQQSVFKWLAALDPSKHRVAIATTEQVEHFTPENWDLLAAFGENLGPEQNVGVFVAKTEDQASQGGKPYHTIMGATRAHGNWLVCSTLRIASWLTAAPEESKARLPAEICAAHIYSDLVALRLHPDDITMSDIPEDVEVAHLKAEYHDFPVDSDPVAASPVARFLRDVYLAWQPDMVLRIALDKDSTRLTYEDKDQLEDWTMQRANARRGFVEVIKVEEADGELAFLSSMAMFRHATWNGLLSDEAELMARPLYKPPAKVRFRSWEETFPEGLGDSWP